MPAVEQVLIAALRDLAAERPVFHSEADLQLALAWVLQQRSPAAQIRLERRMATTPRVELDIFIRLGSERFGIELKYPRAALVVDRAGEVFDLRSGAADVECYSAISDLVRLERLVDENEIDAGCVLMITNSQSVWNPPAAGREFLWDAFRLIEGTELGGTHSYRPTDKAWPGPALVVRGRYPIRWKPFSRVAHDRPGGAFRRLMLSVAG